ncbi:helix-turn-helix domain-containing protein [Paenibacillus sp. TRM 82003]|uniref:GlxA family transcriptional regulator n=1 Tax=Kineococcus sp. TRM81007 TaxID=2925831 RepID=UPI001F5A5F81|nr:helix-turn-helix domain-containing protein [Kineococcus sp. TRM81007]MCI2239249.1 helix-turn-helix domain-containing protein [Kineococcus sp. TRM81007]MCI3924931.1 helix-turn-helix domain-containing protein [Paenibacillus sp. TRM 82003]
MDSLRSVAVVVGEDFSTFEFAIGCEVFGVDRTGDGVPAFEFSVCAPGGAPVRSAQGFTLTPDHGLDPVDEADLVLIGPSQALRGPDVAALVPHLDAALGRGATVASLCSGAFTLARGGYLDGRRATTHHRYAAQLAREFPAVRVVPDVLYVQDGPIATSAGTAAGIDLCLHLVREAHGTAVATAIARRMVVPPHRDGGQAQYVEAPVRPCADESLQRALTWAAAHLDEELDIARWARSAAMSPRTFARRFRAETGVTPHRWLLEQRVAAARLLLEDGDDGVDEVARRCGFSSAAMLRQHFVRLVGTTPTAYRRAYRGAREPRATPLTVPTRTPVPQQAPARPVPAGA